MSAPLVSVIIPCYNSERTVAATVRSLLAQTYALWEGIMVDDGSTDQSVAAVAAETGNEPRYHIIRQTNQGLAGARNAGLRMARGEFLLFLDADDTLLPPMLERMAEQVRLHPRADIVHCGHHYSDVNLNLLDWHVPGFVPTDYFQLFAHQNCFPCHSLLVRRSLLQRTGWFDTSLRHCHDWDLWVRLARAGAQFSCLSEPLVVYRMVPGSLSRRPTSYFEAGREVIRRAHSRDERVVGSTAEVSDGCTCDGSVAVRKWSLYCAASAVAKGESTEALSILQMADVGEGNLMKPEELGPFVWAIASAAAVPVRNGHDLWRCVGANLMEFLVAVERRLLQPGLAARLFVAALQPPPGVVSSEPGAGKPQVNADARAKAKDLFRGLKRRVGRWLEMH